MSRIAIPVVSSRVADYVNVLEHFGAETVIATASDIDVNEFDGLLIPGGADVDPARYGQENRGSTDIDPVQDELQFQVLDLFVKAGKPVLGICRGLQVINVYFGGTLNQDIATRAFHYGERHTTDNGELLIIDRVHGSHALRNTWVYELYGKTVPINSYHHQAVDRLGEGLKAVQISDDGIVEGYVHETLPVYGVQWHPERCGYIKARPDTVDGSLIYRFFVEQCNKK